jgi:hypothetical protein
VTSRRFLVGLLFFVALDFAAPFEPPTRGWFELGDEEESIQRDGRRLERPRAAGPRETAGTAVSVARVRPAPGAERLTREPHPAPILRVARADTSSPPASPDAP